ncbi:MULTISPECIES: cell wall hydrolase [Paenibacillus]|uniref:N-acetylmuramoyl-L-alanine amidase n=1 Tax=Paenibacillus pabuli TaxID=1472 RepID=A0A855YJX7_9BACL|nr:MULTISPECIES: cell wall hydrolase [Paenibacillus]PWW45204.1 N-acetylmuramoyl-L-alanine amidase [Paenibacillus pabuli]PXW11541.1 N-acetylmuramoyl-L-alanine amidase [Paenibacillus taichungensis]RAI92364.1 N-acetylmuramoyl-L-alanine amidase [Paenibacillus pabuli]
MDIISKNRWVAPMLSVLLVCIVGANVVQATGKWNEASDSKQMTELAASAENSENSFSGDRRMMEDGTSLSTEASIQADNWTNSLPAKNWLTTAQEEQQQKEAKAKHAARAAAAAKAKKEAALKLAKVERTKAVAAITTPPQKLYFTRTKLLNQEDSKLATWSYSVSDKELLLLQKIVMAEAEGEPYEGKVAVANVVLNRLRSANFPDTIYKVIYQKSQFSPVANGRLKRVTPNEDSIKAVNAALNGKKEVADDTYYFLSLTLADDLTVARSQKKVKTIGHHTFYK